MELSIKYCNQINRIVQYNSSPFLLPLQRHFCQLQRICSLGAIKRIDSLTGQMVYVIPNQNGRDEEGTRAYSQPLQYIQRLQTPAEECASHCCMHLQFQQSINYISGFATLVQLAFITISIITSFQASIGPGKHQCKQSFWTLAFLSFANG